jgi:hypothetical protein
VSDPHRAVWWDGRKGAAYLDDVEIKRFRNAPRVCGVRVETLDYTPMRQAWRVKFPGYPEREMTDIERNDVESRLGWMVNGALDAFER